MRKIFTTEKLDKIGVSLSAICLLHCLLLPVLLVTLPSVAFLSFFKNPISEAILIILAIGNAILVVTKNFKKHMNFIVPTAFAAGAVMLSLFFFAHELVEQNEYIILIGAALIGSGHLLNTYFCKTCEKCKHER
jgi:hypothetical protein